MTDILEVDILELPKLPQQSDHSLLWNWLHFINARTREELDMVATTDPVIADAVKTVKYLSEEESLRILNEQHQKYLNDKANHDYYVEHIALERGLAEGRATGLDEGKAEGKAEGAKEVRIELCRRMTAKGMPVEEIADLLNLPVAEVAGLRE